MVEICGIEKGIHFGGGLAELSQQHCGMNCRSIGGQRSLVVKPEPIASILTILRIVGRQTWPMNP
jgi:hypothetical protein